MSSSRIARAKLRRFSASISELIGAYRKSEKEASSEADLTLFPLHQAALFGNCQVLRYLIANGANVNEKDNKGMTALHYAAWLSNTEPVNLLLKNMASVRIVNNVGSTPLHIACQHINPETVKILLYYRADPMVKNKALRTPFDVACEYGRTKIAEVMLNSVLVLSQLYANVNDLSEDNSVTPLHLAARNGHVGIIRLLLDAGCSVDRLMRTGSALHDAVRYGRVDVVKLLLQYGADPGCVNAAKERPIDLAERSKFGSALTIAELLNEATQAVYGRAITDYYDNCESALCFSAGDVICIVDRSDERSWTGLIFGRHKSGRRGRFPPSSVQLIDKQIAMQRSSSQRHVKKVMVPVVPEVSFTLNNSSEQVSSNGTAPKSSYRSISVDSVDSDRSVLHSPFSTESSGCFSDGSSFSADTKMPFSPTVLNGNSSAFSFNTTGKMMLTTESTSMVLSPRHRNSTGSNSSQASSGFESMKSNSNPYVNVQVHSLRGDSPPSRNSYHSSGSSSLGSMERLDEMGATTAPMNVAEMALNGIPDSDIIMQWLQELHFEEYIPLFLNAGYDLTSISRMTPEDLTAIGITKPGHRKRLTAEIHRLNIPDSLPSVKPVTLSEWLMRLRLQDYEPLFVQQGYSTVDSVLQFSCQEDLEDLGIRKLGHLKKLMLAVKRLRNPAQHQTDHQNGTCHMTSATAPGEVLVINVSNNTGRSTADSAGLSPNHHQSTAQSCELSTFQHSPRSGRLIKGYCHSDETLHHVPDVSDQNMLLNNSANGHSQHLKAQNSSYSSNNCHANSPAGNHGASRTVNNCILSNGHDAQAGSSSSHDTTSTTGRYTLLNINRSDRSPMFMPNGVSCARRSHCSTAEMTRHQLPADHFLASVVDGQNLSPRHVAVSTRSSPAVSQQTHLGTLGRRQPPPPPKRVSFDIPPVHMPQHSVSMYSSAQDNDSGDRNHSSNMSHSMQMSSLFHLNGNGGCTPSDDSIELSPAVSIEEFPPPPSPIRCENTVQALKLMMENPRCGVQTPSDLLTTEESAARVSYAVSSSLSCSSSNSYVNYRSLNRGASASMANNRKLSAVVQSDAACAGHRNESRCSVDSNSSNEGLPFANENVGTIKSKTPHNITVVSSEIAVQESAPMIAHNSSRVSVAPMTNQNGYTRRPSVIETTNVQSAVLDDIDNMFQNLAQELDALLLQERR